MVSMEKECRAFLYYSLIPGYDLSWFSNIEQLPDGACVGFSQQLIVSSTFYILYGTTV